MALSTVPIIWPLWSSQPSLPLQLVQPPICPPLYTLPEERLQARSFARRDRQCEAIVQRAHRELGVLAPDHARDLDLARRDQLDVDVLGGEQLEHRLGDAGMRAHPYADH